MGGRQDQRVRSQPVIPVDRIRWALGWPAGDGPPGGVWRPRLAIPELHPTGVFVGEDQPRAGDRCRDARSLDSRGAGCIRSGATPPAGFGSAGALSCLLGSRGVSSIPLAGAAPRPLVRQCGASSCMRRSRLPFVRHPLDCAGIWLFTAPDARPPAGGRPRGGTSVFVRLSRYLGLFGTPDATPSAATYPFQWRAARGHSRLVTRWAPVGAKRAAEKSVLQQVREAVAWKPGAP